MKTLKTKIYGIALVAVAGICSAFARAGNEPLPSKLAYEKDKAHIRQHNAVIENHESTIQRLEARLDANRKAGNKSALVIDEQNLSKAKADLKREKEYRKADEKALRRKHIVAIKSHKKELREDRAELRKTKRQLRKDIRQGNEAGIVAGSSKLVKKQRQVDNSEYVLDTQRERMKTDMAVVNEKSNPRKINVAEEQLTLATEGVRTFITPDYE